MPFFFLDADGGQFAFLKEDDTADWSSSEFIEYTSIEQGGVSGKDLSSPKVLDVRDIRTAVILVKREEMTSAKIVPKVYQQAQAYEGWYALTGYPTSPTEDAYSYLVDVKGMDGLYADLTSFSGDFVQVEWAPIPYSDSS